MMTPRKALPIIAAAIIALASCQSTDEYDPAEPYISEGYALTGLEAADAYRRGLDEIGDSEELYYNLAYSYLEAGEWDKAAKVADEALMAYPEHLRFMYLKAYAYRSAMKLYSYECALKDILEFDPGNMAIRTMLMEHYVSIGRKEDAAAIAGTIIERDPQNQGALRALAAKSRFFSAIKPDEEEKPKEKERLWTEPPFLYMPLGILNGERRLSQP